MISHSYLPSLPTGNDGPHHWRMFEKQGIYDFIDLLNNLDVGDHPGFEKLQKPEEISKFKEFLLKYRVTSFCSHEM